MSAGGESPSMAAEDDLVLVVEHVDGRQREVESDENPLSLLQEEDRWKRLWLMTSSHIKRDGSFLLSSEEDLPSAPPPQQQPPQQPPRAQEISPVRVEMEAGFFEARSESMGNMNKSNVVVDSVLDDPLEGLCLCEWNPKFIPKNSTQLVNLFDQNPWLFQRPPDIRFDLEYAAIEMVSKSQEKQLQISTKVESALSDLAHKPPPVNRQTKTNPPKRIPQKKATNKFFY